LVLNTRGRIRKAQIRRYSGQPPSEQLSFWGTSNITQKGEEKQRFWALGRGPTTHVYPLLVVRTFDIEQIKQDYMI